MVGTDMQNYQGVFLANGLSENDIKKKLFTTVTKNNVKNVCIYLTVRHCIPATWLNDRDTQMMDGKVITHFKIIA
jgi:hypothetical protein